MRELVGSTVISQTETYNEALLGKPNKEYQKWILQVCCLLCFQLKLNCNCICLKQDDSWGGAIELAILSSYFGLEIDVVNTQHSIINKFGEDQDYGQRILLIYDGIHYDPLYLEPFDVIVYSYEQSLYNFLFLFTLGEPKQNVVSNIRFCGIATSRRIGRK